MRPSSSVEGEENSGGREKPSLLADCLEAMIGAVYLDSGAELVAAESFVLEHLGESIEEEATRSVLGDPKNVLQELASQLGLEAPAYKLSDYGPEHAKVFTAKVELRQAMSSGRRAKARSKKEAERHAAITTPPIRRCKDSAPTRCPMPELSTPELLMPVPPHA